MREDRYTSDETSAALYEARRGQADDPDDRPTLAELQRDEEPEAGLRHIDAYVCGLCLTSVGAECHVPGCVFWMHDVPTEDTADALRAAIEATS